MNRAYALRLPAPQIAILALLVEIERAGKGCRAWVTVQQLARWSGMSTSGVRDQLNDLLQAGLIERRSPVSRGASLFSVTPARAQ